MNRLALHMIAVCCLSSFENLMAGDRSTEWDEANRRASELQRAGKFAEARTIFESALRSAESFDSGDDRLYTSLNNLASVYQDLGRYSDAQKLYRHAIALIEKQSGPKDVALANPLRNLMSLYAENGQCGPSLKLARRIAGLQNNTDTDKEATNTLFAAAAALQSCKRYSEAESVYVRLLSDAEAQSNSDPRYTGQILNNLAILYMHSHKPAIAAEHLSRAIAAVEGASGTKHPELITLLSNFALAQRELGRQDLVDALFQRAIAIAIETLGTEHPIYRHVMANYAQTLRHLKRKDAAKDAERQARTALTAAGLARLGNQTVDITALARGK
jgi:tetratricopeptide (TPR) repeat protein